MFKYALNLIYLAARIVPAKSKAEIKEYFCVSFSFRLQMKIVKHLK
jgi:hypothetical protein